MKAAAAVRRARLPRLGPILRHHRPWRRRGWRLCWLRGPTEAPPLVAERVFIGLGLPLTGRTPP
eukprot:3453362-Alexandrium_andersonii.AAC.1